MSDTTITPLKKKYVCVSVSPFIIYFEMNVFNM